MKTNALTWLALLLLAITSFFARDPLHGRGATAVILTTAGCKCTALGWQFMDLRSAHWFWRTALLTTIAALLLVVGGAAVRA